MRSDDRVVSPSQARWHRVATPIERRPLRRRSQCSTIPPSPSCVRSPAASTRSAAHRSLPITSASSRLPSARYAPRSPQSSRHPSRPRATNRGRRPEGRLALGRRRRRRARRGVRARSNVRGARPTAPANENRDRGAPRPPGEDRGTTGIAPARKRCGHALDQRRLPAVSLPRAASPRRRAAP